MGDTQYTLEHKVRLVDAYTQQWHFTCFGSCHGPQPVAKGTIGSCLPATWGWGGAGDKGGQ
jgi:hypothetical protein